MKKYTHPDITAHLKRVLDSPLPDIRDIENLKCWEQYPKGLSIGDIESMPGEERRALFGNWWKSVSDGEKKSLKQIASAGILLFMIMGEISQPGTPIGDLFAVVSSTASKEEWRAALDRFMAGRTPVARGKWNAARPLLLEQIDEDRIPTGRSRQQELRSRTAEALVEVFHSLQDRPFEEAVVTPSEFVDLVFRKLSGKFVDHVLAPHRLDEWKRRVRDYDRRRKRKKRGKEIPETDAKPSEMPDPIAFTIELAGVAFQEVKAANEEQKYEVPTVCQIEEDFARRLAEEEYVREIARRARLNEREIDLYRALRTGETREETAMRTGKKKRTVYNSISELRKKIKPFLKS